MDNELCKLCQESQPNMDAHIIAKGLLKLLADRGAYDGKLLIIGKELKTPISKQGGSKDGGILCDSCDNKIGVYDGYVTNFVKSSNLVNYKDGAWSASGLDIEKFKLFCVSYLWRASITNLEEFSGVSLGTVHEEAMRQVLLAGTAKKVDGYDVIVTKFDVGELTEAVNKWMLIPAKQRHLGIMFYEVHLPSLYKIYVKVDKMPTPPQYKTAVLGGKHSNIVLKRGAFAKSKDFKILQDSLH